MKFTTYGLACNPSVLLLHPMFSDASYFDKFIVKLSTTHCVICPTLNGHDGESDFTTLADQVHAIVQYLITYERTQLEFILGTSLGALVAFNVANDSSIKTKQVFMDGTPFFKFHKFYKSIAKSIYLLIWNHSIKQSKWLTKKLHSLFPNHAEHMLQIVRSMSSTSIKNLPDACYSNDIVLVDKEIQASMHFFFGSKEPAKLSVSRIKKLGAVDIRIFKGYGHCEYLDKHSEKYLDILCN